MKIFCSVENCQKHANSSKGMCSMHYARGLYGSQEVKPDTSPMPKCAVPACANRAEHREPDSLCMSHYQLKFRGKDPYEYPTVFENRGECWVDGCPKPVTTKSLCNYHYRRSVRGLLEVPDELGVKLNPPCSFVRCSNLQESGGLCHGHTEQRRAGKDLTPLRVYGHFSKGENKCRVENCSKASDTRNFCKSHYRALARFNLTEQQAVDLFRDERCANHGCKNTTRLHVDHDHVTGKVRGLLCASCNMSLGQLKEDVERILGLAEYKRLHS